MTKRITIAYGDGIGPEIMDAVIKILKYAKARVDFEVIEIGKLMYERGYSSGIPEGAWKSIRDNKVILKAPITTPQGGGYKSLNVTLRKTLSLYANIRPSKSYCPIVPSNFSELDLVVVRENEEDLYAGIEYRNTHNTYTSLKMITRQGCENIIRYAFEYAKNNNRKKVTCFSKDNIMKFTDGLFHQVFNEISAEYPEISNEHMIIDIATAKLANNPKMFDVIVTENLYGDIISDVAAEISGSVGLAGSANIGCEYAMFEAIHGSAPDIAGQNIANPSGLLNASIMMLVHIGQGDVASLIENAWHKTLEDGMHTADIYNKSTSKKKLGTQEFADEVIKRLGMVPNNLPKANYSTNIINTKHKQHDILPQNLMKVLVGVDISVSWLGDDPALLIHDVIDKIKESNLGIKMISNKVLFSHQSISKQYA